MTLQGEIDAKRREIQTDSFQISIGELSNLYRDHELDIHPEFQRFFRWSIEQKSRLVESLLLGIPLPSIFVHQREDGVWDVIDGLQRLSTILQFQGLLLDEETNVVTPEPLVATEYLPSLAGIRRESDDDQPAFDTTQRLLIKRSSIDVKIVKRESDPNTKFDLFQRLNTGGSQLSDQELRNCLLIMAERSFYQWIKELQADVGFQQTLAASDRAKDEQYDLELVIRFLAVKETPNADLRAIGDMADFLTSRALTFARDPSFDRQVQGDEFRRTFKLIDEALKDDAFRRYVAETGRFVGGFSVFAFEALSAGVSANLVQWESLDPERRAGVLAERAQVLWTDTVFRERAGSGFRASQRIPYIVPRSRELFAV